MSGQGDAPGEEYVREIQGKVERLSRARRQGGDFWRHVAHVGSLGFVFVLPLLAGAVLGHFVSQRTGRPILAVTLLLVGLVVGACGSWRLIRESFEGDSNDDH